MGTGYVRNDTANNIADGNIINASDLDGEFDAVQSAFNASTGHTHDGTAGEGAPIETIGPSQDVVATASVLRPKTDNTVDLGTTSLEYKDLFLDGTAHIDTLDVDENASITGTLGVTGTTTLGTANITTGTITTADINGGNIDGTIIGATTAAAITGTTITGTSFVTSGDMTFGNNDKAVFGAGNDLWIYSDGTDSYIEERNGTGSLYIDATDLQLRSTANAKYFRGITGGAVDLYYDNASKLATTSTGISVTGNATFADNGKAIFGAGSDLQIYHDAGGDSYITESNASGQLRIQAGNIKIADADGNNFIYMTDLGTGGLVNLFHNGAEKLATTSTGIDVTGTVTADGLTVDGTSDLNGTITVGTTYTTDITGNNISFFRNNGASYIQQRGGYALAFQTNDGSDRTRLSIESNGDISFYEDTGTTAKFFWDASAESLGIGTSSPTRLLDVYKSDTTETVARFRNASSSYCTIDFKDATTTADNKVRIGADTDDLVMFAGSTEAMRIDSSGRVGINSVPASSRQLEVKNPTGGNAYISAIRSNATSSELVLGAENGNTVISSVGAIPLALVTNGTERMRIDSSGNVGIGTTSPSDKLTLDSGQMRLSDNYGIRWGTASTAIYGSAGAGTLQMYTNSSERMRIDSNGMVNAYYGISVDGGTIKLDGNYPVGTENVALGDQALDNVNEFGVWNVAIGTKALTSLGSGDANTAVGRVALENLTTASNNTALGYGALNLSTTGGSNTAVGYLSLYSNTTASNNTAVGYQAGYANTTGTDLTAIGYQALDANTTGNYSTAVGYSALGANTTGSANEAFGREALRLNTTGSNNTALGYRTLDVNTSGGNNVAVGQFALGNNTTASNNTAVGYQAGYSNTTSSYNTIFGAQAGYLFTNASDGFNTFLGRQSGYNTTGTKNTFIGDGSAYLVTTGSKNTVVGMFTGNQGGLDIRTSSNNIVLSDGDGNPRITANSSGQVSVGDSVGYGGAGFVNTQFTVNANNNDYSAAFISKTTTVNDSYGILVKYSTSPDGTTNEAITFSDSITTRFKVLSDGDVQNHDNSYGAISDVKLKENIEDASTQWDDIKALRIRKYSMKTDNASEANRLGVIAQEVEAAGMSGLVSETPDLDDDRNDLGTVTKAVKYSILYMKAVKALQEAMDRIETLEAKVTALENA